jgi:hypothetical protein
MNKAAQRKRKERERRRTEGQVRLEFWTLPKFVERIKKLMKPFVTP